MTATDTPRAAGAAPADFTGPEFVAVGGDWGGAQGVDDAAFPAWMEVDYVRVYPLLQP